MASPEARITLAIDAMGGDRGPSEVLAGLLKSTSFAPRDSEIFIVWSGGRINRLIIRKF